ncbi:ABC transporter ATP-binding protein [Streptomyces sp. MST-110588]|uniref:ATP-binding cassette domain-containing protein n=1 Tax=Streptomyces sp. MST-110588 TaxID=2833628 RepID=UPI001F5D7F60|nr:ABC transporter ATP-binding protein [Streptomyces sp. MST-110588]UNO43941.1 ABC transporter ATP-binding protein [Streptomyces sp. MST-110588]
MRLDAVGKRYGRGKWVVRDVDVEAPEGEVVAFAGGNGSGKSTLLRILVGVSRPTCGVVSGRPPVIGYVPDRFSPNERMSAAAYLTHMGRIRGMGTKAATARARELLERLALVGGENAPLRSLSKGNAQKVALAQAVMVPPGLLVLDEPWSGLDVTAHGVLGELMGEVAGTGGAVVFTDHRESVTRVRATRTYVVERGRVALRGSEMETEVGEGRRGRACVDVVLGVPEGGEVPRQLDWEGMAGVLAVTERDRQGARVQVRVAVKVEPDCADALLYEALRHGWSVVEVTRTGEGVARTGESVARTAAGAGFGAGAGVRGGVR